MGYTVTSILLYLMKSISRLRISQYFIFFDNDELSI